MSAKNNDAGRLEEIFSLCQDIHRIVDVFSVDRQFFVGQEDALKEVVSNALTNKLYLISEEVYSMSYRVMANDPDMGWDGIRGLRNRLAHDYGSTDYEIIWDSIADDMPRLERLCQQLQGEMGLDLVEPYTLGSQEKLRVITESEAALLAETRAKAGLPGPARQEAASLGREGQDVASRSAEAQGAQRGTIGTRKLVDGDAGGGHGPR